MSESAALVVVGGRVVVDGRVVVVGVLVVERVVVVGGLVVVADARVVAGGTVVRRGTAVDLAVVRWVVPGGLAVAVLRVVSQTVLAVDSPVVQSNGSVVLSSSVDDSSQEVVSSVALVVSVFVGSSGGGLRKRLAKMNVSRIAARKRPMKIAVCLSFLFFRMGLASFPIVSH